MFIPDSTVYQYCAVCDKHAKFTPTLLPSAGVFREDSYVAPSGQGMAAKFGLRYPKIRCNEPIGC